jgi:hypothetical protein
LDWLPILDKAESNRANSSALPKLNFHRRLPALEFRLARS